MSRCDSPEAVRAARRKRSRSFGSSASAGGSVSATGQPRVTSRARTTTPIPPRKLALERMPPRVQQLEQEELRSRSGEHGPDMRCLRRLTRPCVMIQSMMSSVTLERGHGRIE